MPPIDPALRASLVADAAAYYHLHADLLDAQITVESSGDPKAFRYEAAFYKTYIASNPSARGFAYGPLAACSYGLLQILFETALEDGFLGEPHELFDPRQGLFAGAKHLRVLWDRQGGQDGLQYRQAVASYNGVGLAAEAYVEQVYRVAGRA